MRPDYAQTNMRRPIQFSYEDANLYVMDAISKRIKKRRAELGINQVELAKAIGVNQSSISNMERGEVDFSASILMKLAKKLETTPEYIMEGSDMTDFGEREIASIYKQLDPSLRAALLASARGMAAIHSGNAKAA